MDGHDVERASRQLALLYTRPGQRFASGGFSAHVAHFRLLLLTGQYVEVHEGGHLLGWQGWYRVDEPALRYLHDDDTAGLFTAQPIVPINSGAHCYIAASLTAPGASPGVALQLFRMTVERNRDARSICAMRNARGGRRWFQYRRGLAS